ncbi:MAG: Clp protease N-terminal domain-containing protein [Acidimicrobiales bacterium]
MFDIRSMYIVACEEARQRGDRRVRTDHLLLALLRDPQIEHVIGVSHDQARTALDQIDKEALTSIGLPESLDVAPLRERPVPSRTTLHNAWKFHMKISPSARHALREFGPKLRVRVPTSPQQLLLSILENQPPDAAAVLLDELGVDRLALRHRLEVANVE